MKNNFSVPALVIAFATLCLAVSVHSSASGEGPRTAPYPSDIVYGGTGQPVVFSHEMHVGGLGFSCDACHGGLFELEAYAAKNKGDFKMSVMQDGDYCGKCHDGETAFSTGDYAYCGKCHNGEGGAKVEPGLKVVGPEEDIVLGADETAAVFRHGSHDAFRCNKCHTGIFPIKYTKTVTDMDAINSGKACGTCHNGSAAFDATNCGSCHPKM